MSDPVFQRWTARDLQKQLTRYSDQRDEAMVWVVRIKAELLERAINDKEGQRDGVDPEKIPCLFCGKRVTSRCADWQTADDCGLSKTPLDGYPEPPRPEWSNSTPPKNGTVFWGTHNRGGKFWPPYKVYWGVGKPHRESGSPAYVVNRGNPWWLNEDGIKMAPTPTHWYPVIGDTVPELPK